MATKRPGDDSNGNGHAAGNGEAPEAKKTKDVSTWTFKIRKYKKYLSNSIDAYE